MTFTWIKTSNNQKPPNNQVSLFSQTAACAVGYAQRRCYNY